MRSHETVIDTGNRIAGIARSTESASLGLLADINGTVDAMTAIAQVMSGFSKMLTTVRDGINGCKVVEGSFIDPDDVAIDSLVSAANQLKERLPVLVRKKGSIDCDCRLKEHHCEALHDAYDQAIEAVADLIEVLEETRQEIISYDLKAEPRDTESFETVESLIASLRAQ